VNVRIKICGVTRVDDALAAVALGVEMIGLNFHPPSPRSVTLERALEIRRAIGRRCEVVGVFVNADREYVAERLGALTLDLLQFHGDEDETALAGWPVRVIRALRLLKDELRSDRISGTRADYVLLDAFHPQLYGGTGRTLPLEALSGLALDRTFISGGLTPENVAKAVALRPFAVDVASGVESAPGIKDASKLRSFVANAKSAR
jgi:phosphoribosylanthranilate isomerase